MKRLVRTRMPGVVGEGWVKTSPYPTSYFLIQDNKEA